MTAFHPNRALRLALRKATFLADSRPSAYGRLDSIADIRLQLPIIWRAAACHQGVSQKPCTAIANGRLQAAQTI
jgi:hypothetical protein